MRWNPANSVRTSIPASHRHEGNVALQYGAFDLALVPLKGRVSRLEVDEHNGVNDAPICQALECYVVNRLEQGSAVATLKGEAGEGRSDFLDHFADAYRFSSSRGHLAGRFAPAR